MPWTTGIVICWTMMFSSSRAESHSAARILSRPISAYLRASALAMAVPLVPPRHVPKSAQRLFASSQSSLPLLLRPSVPVSEPA